MYSLRSLFNFPPDTIRFYHFNRWTTTSNTDYEECHIGSIAITIASSGTSSVTAAAAASPTSLSSSSPTHQHHQPHHQHHHHHPSPCHPIPQRLSYPPEPSTPIQAGGQVRAQTLKFMVLTSCHHLLSLTAAAWTSLKRIPSSVTHFIQMWNLKHSIFYQSLSKCTSPTWPLFSTRRH